MFLRWCIEGACVEKIQYIKVCGSSAGMVLSVMSTVVDKFAFKAKNFVIDVNAWLKIFFRKLVHSVRHPLSEPSRLVAICSASQTSYNINQSSQCMTCLSKIKCSCSICFSLRKKAQNCVLKRQCFTWVKQANLFCAQLCWQTSTEFLFFFSSNYVYRFTHYQFHYLSSKNCF